jgi:UDP-2,3-diacylglucosamine pyrophosphatase LpxH
MITTVREQRMLVVSDVHLGNALFDAVGPFAQFLRFARESGFNLCINGDGVDIVQTTLTKFTRDLGRCAGELRKFARDGLRVYYTVGNHDIVLEHFLDDWNIVRVAPFLNVDSGDARIRVEHGHLYDETYVHHPRLYTVATVLGGLALRIHPAVYKGLERSKLLIEQLGSLTGRSDAPATLEPGWEAIPDEPLMFRERANEIARHGFDTVIFGHTHCWGQVRLPSGATYINTGSWFYEPHFAEINSGVVTLKRVADNRVFIPEDAATRPAGVA